MPAGRSRLSTVGSGCKDEVVVVEVVTVAERVASDVSVKTKAK